MNEAGGSLEAASLNNCLDEYTAYSADPAAVAETGRCIGAVWLIFSSLAQNRSGLCLLRGGGSPIPIAAPVDGDIIASGILTDFLW